MKTDFPTERKVCHGVGITCTDEQEDRNVCHGKQDPQSAMTGHHMSVVLTFKQNNNNFKNNYVHMSAHLFSSIST